MKITQNPVISLTLCLKIRSNLSKALKQSLELTPNFSKIFSF